MKNLNCKCLLLFTLTGLLLPAIGAHAATHVWKGSAGDNRWSIASNWSAGGVPSVGEAQPIDLVFPASPTSLNSICDVASPNPLVLNSMVIQGGNYTFSGFPSAQLSFVTPSGTSLYVSSVAAPTVTFAATIYIDLGGESLTTITSSSGNLYFNGTVSGDLFNGGIPMLWTYGAGHVHFGGSSVNRMDLVVQNGSSVHLAKTSGALATYSLSVNSGTVYVEGDQQIGQDPTDTGTILINPDPSRPVVALNAGNLIFSPGVSQSIGLLTIYNASVIDASAAGADVGLYDTVTVGGQGNEIKGTTDLGGETRHIAIQGATPVNPVESLKLSGPIIDGVHYVSGFPITATGGINLTGIGELFLEGNNSYHGPVIINNLHCTAHSSTAFGATTGGVSVSGADSLLTINASLVGNEALSLGSQLTVSNVCSWAGPITLQAGGKFQVSAGAVLTNSGAIGGVGPLFLNGTGIMELAGASGNTYTVGTYIYGGTLRLNKSAGTALPAGGYVNIQSDIPGKLATLETLRDEQIPDTMHVFVGPDDLVHTVVNFFRINSHNETIGSLSGFGGDVVLGTGKLSLGQDNSTTIFSGRIFGTGGVCLVKLGSGTFTLDGDDSSGSTLNNIYTGTTQVIDGTLIINDNQTSDFNVGLGATLAGNGSVGTVYLDQGNISLSHLTTGFISGFTGSHLNGIMDNNSAAQQQLTTTVAPTLTGIGLNVFQGSVPSAGSVYTIIKNNSGTPVVGTLTGLAEGATVTLNGKPFTISYHGGDGNDVTLSLISGGSTNLVVVSINRDNATGLVSLVGKGLPNTTYNWQSSPDLKNWSLATNSLSGATGIASANLNSAGIAKMFYRLMHP